MRYTPAGLEAAGGRRRECSSTYCRRDPIHAVIKKKILSHWRETLHVLLGDAIRAGELHAEPLAGMFRKAGVRAEAIHGSLRLDERARRIRDFHLGRLELLTNCQVLTEGFDEPRVSCIIMARPTCSSLLYIQCVGRGTRIAPGKDDCIVIDIVDNTRRHASQLVTLPTLFGLPPEFNLEGIRGIMHPTWIPPASRTLQRVWMGVPGQDARLSLTKS